MRKCEEVCIVFVRFQSDVYKHGEGRAATGAAREENTRDIEGSGWLEHRKYIDFYCTLIRSD